MNFNEKSRELLENAKFQAPDVTKIESHLQKLKEENKNYEKSVRANQRITNETLFQRFTI